MCELLGFSSAEPTDISEVLRKFFSHSIKHPHGWGLMFENGSRQVIRDPSAACESPLLEPVLRDLPPQTAALAHIRFATVGSIKEENCHPFTARDRSGREWTLIHNGTIFNGRFTHRYSSVQSGDTDSERFFLHLMDAVNRQLLNGIPTDEERFRLISRVIADNAPRNKLNLMIYDGSLLYVHKNLKNTLSYKKIPGGLLFATVPLDDGQWEDFPLAQVYAFRNGREVMKAEPHSGIFVPALDHITTADAMYI